MTYYNTVEAYFTEFYETLCKHYTPKYTDTRYMAVLAEWGIDNTKWETEKDIFLAKYTDKNYIYEYLHCVLWMDDTLDKFDVLVPVMCLNP